MSDPLTSLILNSVSDPLTPLILDFVEWLAVEPRAHAEVVDVWRTSCPRLTVWEDATDRGFVTRQRQAAGGETRIAVTPLGRRFLEVHGRIEPAPMTRASA